MYHTNQCVHFQGGERRGISTSCSLAGEFFESFCQKLRTRKADRIEEIKDFLLKLDGRKKYGSQPLKKSTNKVKEDNTLKCDSCHYKTVTKSELKRHLFLTHQKKAHPTSMKTVTFKLDKEPKSNDHEEVNLDSECLDCHFSCKEESELDVHMKTVHQKVVTTVVVTEQERADQTRLLNELWIENSVLINEKNSLKIKQQEMIEDMTTMKSDIGSLISGKEKAEAAYQEATKVIAQQQGRLTEQNETIKVLKGRLEIELGYTVGKVMGSCLKSHVFKS